jgi:hypothetical protein
MKHFVCNNSNISCNSYRFFPCVVCNNSSLRSLTDCNSSLRAIQASHSCSWSHLIYILKTLTQAQTNNYLIYQVKTCSFVCSISASNVSRSLLESFSCYTNKKGEEIGTRDWRISQHMCMFTSLRPLTSDLNLSSWTFITIQRYWRKRSGVINTSRHYNLNLNCLPVWVWSWSDCSFWIKTVCSLA